MNGMEMMFASFGPKIEDMVKKHFPPEKLEGYLKPFIDEVKKMNVSLEEIKAKLTRIEIKLKTMPDDEIMKLLSDGKEIAEEETVQYVRDNTDGSGNDGSNDGSAVN